MEGQLPCLLQAANQAEAEASRGTRSELRSQSSADGERSDADPDRPAGNARVPGASGANPHPPAGQARCRRASARWNTATTSAMPTPSARGRLLSESGTSGRGTLAATLAPVSETGAKGLAVNVLLSAMLLVLSSPRTTKMRTVDIVNTQSDSGTSDKH